MTNPGMTVFDKLLIHIGYHKTGTSWLQAHFFGNPQVGTVQPFGRAEDLRPYLTVPDDFDFDPQSSRRHFGRRLDGLTLAPGQVPVLSYEALCGNPHGGMERGGVMADRLRAVFPEARILIVIREQRSMVLSTYRQFIKIGGGCSLRDYLQSAERHGNRVRPFAPEHFRYDRLIRYYQQLYGESRVLTLPFEDLVQSPAEFLAAIANFAGIGGGTLDRSSLPIEDRANRGLSGIATGLRRTSNRLLRGVGIGGCGLFLPGDYNRRLHRLHTHIDQALPGAWRARRQRRDLALIDNWAGGYYQGSNRRVIELTGMALDGLGYHC
jgi:hypothetical protein